MLKYITHFDNETGSEWIETNLTGKSVMLYPLLNKGTAFTHEERRELKLLGKLPYRVETLQEQLARTKGQFRAYSTTLQKYIFLNNLHDKNEILFYKLLSEDLAEILPLIYTPGVSAAVEAFSHEFRQPRGLYISYPDMDKMDEILENRTHAEIDLMVVTDGERILGIGDQGIGGIDIPNAKAVVYGLCGMNPYKMLPVMLDVGTNNERLLNDPLYLGWRHPRLQGKEYDDFIACFVETVQKKFPLSFLHWEDFGQKNARRILETYRTQHCSFNDDMQGTGVVTLAALLSAMKATKIPLNEQRIVILGAGTAGVGVADQLYRTFIRHGIEEEKARRQFWLVDRPGLLCEGMQEITHYQKPYLRPNQEGSLTDLLSVVKKVKPTILIGCSTVRKAFTEEIVREMSASVDHPIIFPLSNPNENAEADPLDLLEWSKGKALIATGSPFAAIEYQGTTHHITQCNNALSFPGIGIGVIASRAKEVTDNMLWAASQAIADHAPVQNDFTQPLLPPITTIPALAQHVAFAVAQQAVADKVARVVPNANKEEFIRENIWKPYYRPIKLQKKTQS